MVTRSLPSSLFRRRTAKHAQTANAAPALRVAPPKVIGTGWLLRLRFENHGSPSRFVARAIPGSEQLQQDLSALALTWRDRGGAVASVDLHTGESRLVRLAIAQTALSQGRLTFLAQDDSDTLFGHPIAAEHPIIVRVEVLDATDNGAVVATEWVTISFREHDLVPTVVIAAADDPRLEPDVRNNMEHGDEGQEPRSSRDEQFGATKATARARGDSGDSRPRRLLDQSYLEDVLRCARCGGTYNVGDTAMSCRSCAALAPVVDGIPVLLHDSTSGTKLEEIDYDAVHGVNDALIRQVGSEWRDVINRLNLPHRDVLEIGAGTGALTLGLLQGHGIERLTATDVSHRFVALLRERAAQYAVPQSFLACDANEQHFRNSAFDLVVGRSILHHLLDFSSTLRNSCDALREGGAAIFFEPIVEGKTIVSLLMALVLRCDELSDRASLSADDRRRMRREIRHQLKAKLASPDQDLSELEDKYIFELDELRLAGRRAGFRDVEFLNSEVVVPTYWPYLVQTLQTAGIDPAKVSDYKWIGVQFANTFGLMFADRLVTPMGYFVFRK